MNLFADVEDSTHSRFLTRKLGSDPIICDTIFFASFTASYSQYELKVRAYFIVSVQECMQYTHRETVWGKRLKFKLVSQYHRINEQENITRI